MRIVKLSQPYITKESINKVVEVLENGWLIQGPKVTIFEDAFKKYVGS